MSNDLNQWQGIGRLGKDPETRFTPSGDAVTNFSIACGEEWKDKTSGEKVEKTEWVRCVAFGKLAEIAGKYLKKGKQCYVSGKLTTRKWVDKEGVERYSTEVVIDRMQLLGGRDEGEAPAPAPRAQQRPAQAPAPKTNTGTGFDEMDSEIPF